MEFVYGVLLVSILIFIHEFGHFVFAKLFGVKVLTFSIGFGPKLLRVRGKETSYCLGILPFGGFVKMLEEARGKETILPEDRHRTFEAQAVWKRILIVLAGPAMNLLFPILLYTTVYLEDRELSPPVVGAVEPGMPADGKLLPGDVITAVDGVAIDTSVALQEAIAHKAGKSVKVTVNRDDKPLDVFLVPKDESVVLEPRDLDLVEHVARIGVSHKFVAPVIGVPATDSPAYRAGLRTFDRVTAVNGRKLERFVDLITLLSANRGDTIQVTYLRPRGAPEALGGVSDIAVFDPGVVTLTPLPKDPEAKEIDHVARERDVLLREGIEGAEMYAALVPEGSSEWQAGLRPGDRLRTLDGQAVDRWKSVQFALKNHPEDRHELGWTRDGEALSGTFTMRKETWHDEAGVRRDRYVFRTTNWQSFAIEKFVKNPGRITYALTRGLRETGRVVQFIVVGFLRILQGKVSIATVSGPIAMFDVAGEAGIRGTTYFLWAMALVSVNLGLVNLLPVPVLDGGHLLFFLWEGISRRPLSRRAREIASLLGMILLIGLAVLSIKNDVARRWDAVGRTFRETMDHKLK